MKKLFATLLALVMVLSMSAVAFAVDYTPVAAGTSFTLTKTYDNENEVIVTEKLSFTATADDENPAEGNVTVADVDVDSASETITVTLPGYTKAGVYRYTITENAGTAAGVTYSTDTIHVIVLVGYDNDNNKLVIENTSSFIEKKDGTKNSEFANTFASGDFSVAKEVTGNLADKNDKFKITVTLTAPANKTINTPIMVAGEEVAADQWTGGVYTTTLTLSQADGATAFENIPVGVTVSVSEDVEDTGYTQVSITDDGALTVADDTDAEIVVTNEKSTTVDTGISLDSMPYILMLAVAVIGVVALAAKKRVD